MIDQKYKVLKEENAHPIKAWVNGVEFEDAAKAQLDNLAHLPFIHKHIAVMPDVHIGIGSTVGSGVPTHKAIIPAAVGVDLGCGILGVKTTLKARDLPDNLAALRSVIEDAIPHGRTDNGGSNDRGAWGTVPDFVAKAWVEIEPEYKQIIEKHPKASHRRPANQFSNLGSGNHFVEVCLDEQDNVWLQLHSGSRGVGNKIGSYFIELAKKDMRRFFINLPDANLAYLPEGTEHFDDYIQAMTWAQRYAFINRELMMAQAIRTMKVSKLVPNFDIVGEVINCYHNYCTKESHFGENVWVTRKGAVRARKGDLGIIPGSMGAFTFIVTGKGNPESFNSCSHGAGRRMSRTKARETFTLKDHREATASVECRKDKGVIDETPGAYKNIKAVMDAQSDLVDIIHTLKPVLCIKG